MRSEAETDQITQGPAVLPDCVMSGHLGAVKTKINEIRTQTAPLGGLPNQAT